MKACLAVTSLPLTMNPLLAVKSGDGGAVVVGMALRFALTAPPFGLRRATLRARPTTKKRSKTKSKKGTLLTR